MDDYPRWTMPFINMYTDSPIATFILDEALEIQWKNKSAENRDDLMETGPNPEECIFHGKKCDLIARLREGKPFTLIEPIPFKNPISLVFQPQIDESGLFQGALVHVFGLQNNVSPQNARDGLHQPITILNNQFRTPLSQIFSILNLLQADYQQDNALQKYLHDINWHCYRILRTVINFSTDSRILAGQFKPKLLAGDLCHFIYTLCQDTADLLKSSGYVFSFDIPQEPFITLYDGDLLSCAICNLISNACKFTKADGGTISFRMSVFEKQATITITDNGSGMSPTVLERAFDRFYSLDPKTGAPDGDGLGLFIARMVMHLHDGTIALQTKEGKGTIAALTIPLRKPDGNAALCNDAVPLSEDRFSNLYVILSDPICPDF
ncbi:MAG: HAMP domain-containing sensor histidine kinase [Oscillospiraceae bacterium]|nr:HAMP domain-containing sensor histidine kinase [Oscillospiraceae bacterium]